jgi:hypothetical protein
MARAKEKAIVLLGYATLGMQTADGAQTAYTVPTGKEAMVDHYIVHSPTGSLAGGNDFDFGDGANRDTFKQTVDLSGMTATTDYIKISNDNTKRTIYDAGDTLGMKPITGSTADVDAVVEVWGHEQDT